MIQEFLDLGTIVSCDKDRVVIGWGKRTWVDNLPDQDIPVFYFPDYFLKNEKNWFYHENSVELSLTDLIEKFCCTGFQEKSFWSNPNVDVFRDEFKALKLSINEGALQKAVPYIFRQSTIEMTINRIQHSLYKLSQYLENNLAYLYGFWGEHEGMLGATPELLLSMDQQGLLNTVAIAGTSPIDKSGMMLDDEKLKNEHQFVIDGITQSLSSYGKLTIGTTEILKLKKLSHLKTPILVSGIRDIAIEEMVKQLHPTPALGTFPKQNGSKWLQKYQVRIPRGRYGAPVGFLYRGLFKSYVAIRNIQWKDQDIKLGVGCGVVALSDLENEVNELQLKFEATKELLGL